MLVRHSATSSFPDPRPLLLRFRSTKKNSIEKFKLNFATTAVVAASTLCAVDCQTRSLRKMSHGGCINLQ